MTYSYIVVIAGESKKITEALNLNDCYLIRKNQLADCYLASFPNIKDARLFCYKLQRFHVDTWIIRGQEVEK